MTDYADLVREARERAEKATPGPWEWEPPDLEPHAGDVYLAHDLGTRKIARVYGHEDDEQDYADAWFIAHARTDIPALCAALQAQAARITELEAALGEEVTIKEDADGVLSYKIPLPRIIRVTDVLFEAWMENLNRLRRVEEAAKVLEQALAVYEQGPGMTLAPSIQRTLTDLRVAAYHAALRTTLEGPSDQKEEA